MPYSSPYAHLPAPPTDEITAAELEAYKATLTAWLADRQSNATDDEARLAYSERAAVEYAKALFLLNGGALVAVLSLVGSLASKLQNPQALDKLLLGVGCFAVGLVLTLTGIQWLAVGTNWYAQDASHTFKKRLKYALGIVPFALALAAFMSGVVEEEFALRHLLAALK